MTTERAEAFVKKVLELRRQVPGSEDEQIIPILQEHFEGEVEDFEWALEMISTGAFRAAIISSGTKYPKSNLQVGDDPILQAAFKLCWIEAKGKEHYLAHFGRKRKKWWAFWR